MCPDIATGVGSSTKNRLIIGAGFVIIDFVDGSLTGGERKIGATKGGNVVEITPEYLDVGAELDGTYGSVAELDFIVGLEAKITCNLQEMMTTENLVLLMGGLESNDRTWTAVHGEYLGTGLELDGGITVGGGSDIDTASVEVYHTAAGGGIPTLATLTTDYTVSAAGEVTRVGSNIADTDEVTVDYKYDSSGSSDDFDIITLNHLDSGDYRDIALAGRPTNAGLSNYFYYVLKNALANGGLNANLQKKQALVHQITFRASWQSSDLSLDNAPFEIWNPMT